MKKSLQKIVQTKLFDASLAFCLFLIVTLGLNFAIGATFNAVSIIIDIILSLAVAFIVFTTTQSKKLSHKIIKRRSEHLAVAGMLGIGFLLFIVFIIVYIIE
jgi:NADH:ubiquinone oxidoreductase subunit 6 (subunit J)